MAKHLAFLYPEHLSLNVPSLEALKETNSKDVIFIESEEEGAIVPHHKQKLVLWFTAMRKFAQELKERGYRVHYIELTSSDNKKSIPATLTHFLKSHSFEKVYVTHPSDFRQLEYLREHKAPIEILGDTRFLSERFDFEKYASSRKTLIMEFFYRELRKSTGILMSADKKPIGGAWNFDKDNRSGFSRDRPTFRPKKTIPCPVTEEVIRLVNEYFPKNFGTTDNFYYATSRSEALKVLNHFINEGLPHFGQYQDIMDDSNAFLFHSILSPYINLGLLSPLEVIEKAEKAYHKGLAPINAVEGFIRQILGWREFIRCIYWHFMPDYADSNFFKFESQLPDFYWSGETKMNCVNHVVKFTHKYAYSHHIQRLMITGNLAVLMGINPKYVHEWYLAVYSDAYEWVELPNTVGMALFADGGILGTKPYVSSGNYINKMSNYCKGCFYNVKEKTGATACPFNYLYWDFLSEHKDKLENNPRLKFAYNTLSKFKKPQLEQYTKDAKSFKESIPRAKY